MLPLLITQQNETITANMLNRCVLSSFEGLLSPMLADNGKSDKEILVLNSINFNLPWARNFYWYVHDVLQEQGITAERNHCLSRPCRIRWR